MRALGVLVYRRGDLHVQLDPQWRPPMPPRERAERAKTPDLDRGLRGVRRPRMAT
jgi:hypothetical protein